ncbi:hypothetical protein HAX54_019531 [Datura stramonium]|uniref:FHA domain-containing protein n=1 Tax=Datura stramonium TaxID=4076 RepID=A0ABS8URM2_DATST|nr:hypothetical protein [Datura stramonium]
MVATRRSGSLPLPSTGNKKSSSSSSSDDKPSSPKRQKVDDDNVDSSEKSVPPAENQKELCSTDQPEFGADGATDGKVNDAPGVSVVTPVAEGAAPVIVDNPRSLFSLRKHNQGSERKKPWCRLLSENPQHQTVQVSAPILLVVSGKDAALHIKSQGISATVCSIRLTQHEGNWVAVLESTGSKGPVQVNEKTIKKNSSCFLNSGDEVVFDQVGYHAYIFQQLWDDSTFKSPSDVRTSGRDASAVAGASILASLSSPWQDLSCLKPTSEVSGKNYQGNELPPSPVIHEDKLDGLKVDSATNIGSSNAADVGLTSEILCLDGNLDFGIEAGNMLEEIRWTRESMPASTSGISLRSAVFKEEIHAAIIDGQDIEVSFDDFPYYLSENTKNVLIAATYIHLKHREQVKYTSELPAVNSRILLSGPAGSEIYQEMLVKALAHYYGAKLLIFDFHAFSGGLPVKEAGPMKEGYSADKSSSRLKQIPGEPDWNKGSEPSSGRTANTNSLTDPSCLAAQPKIRNDNISSLAGASKNTILRTGDRVRFIGSGSGAPYSTPIRGPTFGTRGMVVFTFIDNPSAKVGVKFDKPIPYGVNLGGLCDDARGFFCKVSELHLESTGVDNLEKFLTMTLFEVVLNESRNSPFILFMKDAEKSMAGSSESYSTFKSRLEKLPDNVVIIGSHAHTDNHKEKENER